MIQVLICANREEFEAVFWQIKLDSLLSMYAMKLCDVLDYPVKVALGLLILDMHPPHRQSLLGR